MSIGDAIDDFQPKDGKSTSTWLDLSWSDQKTLKLRNPPVPHFEDGASVFSCLRRVVLM